jgi:hypothetical protein
MRLIRDGAWMSKVSGVHGFFPCAEDSPEDLYGAVVVGSRKRTEKLREFI